MCSPKGTGMISNLPESGQQNVSLPSLQTTPLLFQHILDLILPFFHLCYSLAAVVILPSLVMILCVLGQVLFPQIDGISFIATALLITIRSKFTLKKKWFISVSGLIFFLNVISSILQFFTMETFHGMKTNDHFDTSFEGGKSAENNLELSYKVVEWEEYLETDTSDIAALLVGI